MMIHNCHTCMGRPPLVMPFFFFFEGRRWSILIFTKGDSETIKPTCLSDGWTWAASQALCLKSSLSIRPSSMSRNVLGEAIGRWGFVSASQQNKPVWPIHCLAFLSSFFSLSTAPHPWPFRHSASVFKNLQSSRLWGCLHMNSRGSGFTKRTIFREGRLSRRIIFYQ